ncbi:hypothetical protein S7711_10315 [Stachybotrys chartarum IBT 7711]|uniref:Uncharacterized protein n=1 Tax=Stachybotrys chartarum (strain CBS 109288 / IBT 7711) TaxID=1280523 RepID=A0A084BAB9_STACB|nr:hypothetical protein S7711_10315 [Stachybotrys chartarum IBT 7711]
MKGDITHSDLTTILTSHCHHCATGGRDRVPGTPSTPKLVFPPFPLTESELPKEDEVSAYSVWQRSRVTNEERKK